MVWPVCRYAHRPTLSKNNNYGCNNSVSKNKTSQKHPICFKILHRHVIYLFILFYLYFTAFIFYNYLGFFLTLSLTLYLTSRVIF